nr:hypothetical protein [uncultured Tolumonas sp.]
MTMNKASIISLLMIFISFSSNSETTFENVFHCEYKDQSVDLFVGEGRVSYVHKKNGITDFIFPNDNKNSLSLFKMSVLPTIGGADVKISFKNSSYVYVIYDLTRKNMGDYESDSGFYVISNGRDGAKKSCENEGATIKKKAYDILNH